VGFRDGAGRDQGDFCRAAANPVTDGLDRLVELIGWGLIGWGRILPVFASGEARR
jgi:hypothetical protein